MAEPLHVLKAAAVPVSQELTMSTNAPYTMCRLGSLMLGGRPTTDMIKSPVELEAYYDLGSGRMDALARLTRPTDSALVTLPNDQQLLGFNEDVHSIKIGVSPDHFGLSFLAADNSEIRPLEVVSTGLISHIVLALKHRVSSKIIDRTLVQ